MPKGIYPRVIGVNQHNEIGQCMVIGCHKRALYRRDTRTHRGYCADHKILAIRQPHSSRLDRLEDEGVGGQGDWRIHVDDEVVE
jgi:hypothetical protein